MGLEEAHIADTLCSDFLVPVLDLAIAPARRAGADRLPRALAALADPETGELVGSGVGELHLEIVVDRLRREFGVEVVTGAPQVAYRGTPVRDGDFEHKLVRQTGGRGQYAHILLAWNSKAG